MVVGARGDTVNNFFDAVKFWKFQFLTGQKSSFGNSNSCPVNNREIPILDGVNKFLTRQHFLTSEIPIFDAVNNRDFGR